MKLENLKIANGKTETPFFQSHACRFSAPYDEVFLDRPPARHFFKTLPGLL